MKITFLEMNTVTNGDIDLSPLIALGESKFYDTINRNELLKTICDTEAIICNKTIIDREVIDSAKDLKYIGLFATGYNNIDIEYAHKRNITVCNVASYSTNAVAQLVFSLLLYFENNTEKYINSVKQGDWQKQKLFSYFPYSIAELNGKTFGIFGYGSIGKAVAKIANAFGMNVLISTRTVPTDCAYEIVCFEELLQQSDYLSLHSPLNEQTKQIINETTLSKMKSNSILINTARGGLIDEDALYRALQNKYIRGACLDVLCQEPMSANQRLHTLDNCLITPHIAWAGQETRQRLVNIVAENINCFLMGKPQNVIK